MVHRLKTSDMYNRTGAGDSEIVTDGVSIRSQDASMVMTASAISKRSPILISIGVFRYYV